MWHDGRMKRAGIIAALLLLAACAAQAEATYNNPTTTTSTTSTTSTTTTTSSTTTTTTTLPPGVVTPFAVYTPPTCDSVGTLAFPDDDRWDVLSNEDGTYTFVANEGSVFPEGFEATVGPFPLAQLVGEVCNGTTTTTTTTTLPPPDDDGGTTTTTAKPGLPSTG